MRFKHKPLHTPRATAPKTHASLFRLLPLFLALFTFPAPAHALDTQDFRFTDFTADYYLERADDGTNTLHVKEVLTAEFPEDINQNHGIIRVIPRLNQDGENRVIKSRSALNFKALRNGQPEHVNRFESSSEEYTIYLGSPSAYVHGTQVYTLEYDFANVITAFDSSGTNVSADQNATVAFQELYWDTNGTAWDQSFDHLTANLHLPADVADRLNPQDTSCYVGHYGLSGAAAQARCTITRTADGYSFSTSDLAAGENLTFAVDFLPDTFRITIDQNYILLAVFAIVLLITAAILIPVFIRWLIKARRNQKLYKHTFVTPQYLPPKDVSVAEGVQAYVGKAKASYVATLLELAVQHKVTIKTINKRTWSVVLNVAPEALTIPEYEMLSIIAYEHDLVRGVEIPIRSHEATRPMAEHAAEYETQSILLLVEKGYFRNEKSITNSRPDQSAQSLKVVVFTIASVFFFGLFAANLNILLADQYTISGIGPHLFGAKVLPICILACFIGCPILFSWFRRKTTTFRKYTEKGIALARYLDGLKEYIELAESDRLAFLQSVSGVDVSPAGLVHLYEQLLPWACVFGVEESWATELNKYYTAAVAENSAFSDPLCSSTFLSGVITGNIISDIDDTVKDTSGYYSTSSSSGGGGGSSSSSSSGGGGGGSSGGGGGGGGGGGW